MSSIDKMADTTPYTIKCFQCNQDYPILEIRQHREECSIKEEKKEPAMLCDSDDEVLSCFLLKRSVKMERSLCM